MFDSLASKLQQAFRRLTSKGRLTEQDVDQACREIRLALLEADVNFKVVKDFIAEVKQLAIGQQVLTSLDPGQQVIKIVHDQLVELLGPGQQGLVFAPKPPSAFMLVGLQGGGKTTTAGKLGAYLRQHGYRPLLVATDIRRPAAIDQLRMVGEQLSLPVFQMGTAATPAVIALQGRSHAQKEGLNPLIIDTGGRLHLDQELMNELVELKQALSPQGILLVLDAMTGQDAVNVAAEFDRALEVTGFILTKLDGDARGGAALSIRAVTGKPILFAGVGEKLDALEPFYPERIASRILGMGDIVTLVEKAQAAFDQDQAEKLERKLRSKRLDLEDFLTQIRQMNKLGPLDQLLDMMPGFGGFKRPKVELDPRQIKRMEAILLSMTSQERRHPELLNGSRRRRIALGSGTSVQQVNQLLGQFQQMKAMLGQLADAERRGRLRLPI